MVNVVYVCGLPATGKNTLLTSLKNDASTAPINVVSFGDQIKRTMKEGDFPDVDRDRIKQDFTYEDQKTLIFEALKRTMIEYAEKDTIFLHGHSMLITPYGYLPGFPTILYKALKNFYSEEQFYISMLVHLDEDPEKIRTRRKNDDRDRQLRSFDEIEHHLELSEMAMNSIAFNLFVPLVELDTSKHSLEKTKEIFREKLQARGIL